MFEKVKIVKLFGSDEYRVRNKAHKAVMGLLKMSLGDERKQLSARDLLGIWKGLYTWLWMQDKPLLHEEVVTKICDLLPQVSEDALAIEFIRTFFTTFEREWPRIDTHRIDKFYMLIRDFFQAQLRWLADKQGALLDKYLAVLGAALSHQAASAASPGLTLHFYDVLIDEILKTAEGRSVAVTTDLVVKAVLPVLGVCRHQLIIDRINQAVLGPLEKLAASGKLQIDLTRVGSELLAGTASPDLRTKTRKMMYYFANKFLRCAGQTGEERQQETVPITDTQMDPECYSEPTPVATEQQISQKKDKKGKKKKIRETAPIADAPMDIECPGIPSEVTAVTTEQQSSLDGMVKKSKKKGKKRENNALVEDHQMDIDLPDQSVVVTNSKKSPNGKMKKSKKTEMNKRKEKTTETSRNEDADKRVTFGKRYTKKFSDASVSVALSQGSVKQTQIKSILKRK